MIESLRRINVDHNSWPAFITGRSKRIRKVKLKSRARSPFSKTILTLVRQWLREHGLVFETWLISPLSCKLRRCGWFVGGFPSLVGSPYLYTPEWWRRSLTEWVPLMRWTSLWERIYPNHLGEWGLGGLPSGQTQKEGFTVAMVVLTRALECSMVESVGLRGEVGRVERTVF